MENSNEKYTFIYESITPERLDKFLAAKNKTKGYSRVFLTNLIINGFVVVNNLTVTKPKLLLKNNDIIIITIKKGAKTPKLKATAMEIPIIHEDEEIIIINKPNNLVVHPGAGNYDNTLVNGLLHDMKTLSPGTNYYRPGIVHRLDKQTSGLLIVAKTMESHYFLSEQLKKQQIKRIYIALVHGTIIEKTGTIKAPITRDQNNRLKMAVGNSNSKMAVTHFEVLERFSDFTLISCKLETGRTHQIRVHMQWINHCIFNDPVYYQIKAVDTNIGQYLHANAITFIHPKTKKTVIFKSDLPQYFKDKLEQLRKEKSN